MLRSRLTLLAVAVLVLVIASQATAAPPTVDNVETALRASPSYVDPAVTVPAAAKARLAQVARERRRTLRLAVLSGVPRGATSAAEAARVLRQRLGFRGTVVLAVPGGLAVASPTPGSAAVAKARQAASGKVRAAALTAFATSLVPRAQAAPTGTTRPTTAATGQSASGDDDVLGLPWWVWVVLGGVVAIVGGLALLGRGRTSSARRGAEDQLATAHRLAQSRVADLGRGLAETEIAAGDRDDPELRRHHRQASELVTEVRNGLADLDGPPAFRRANELLDEAEWHLGVAQAHADGSAEPRRPEAGRPARCFFDAAHGLSTVDIPLEIPGDRAVTVGVCAADAVRLSRGEDPEVGVVAVGRRNLPWAAAPTWFGGWGWGDDDLPALRFQGRPVFAAGLSVDALTQPAPQAPVDDAPDGPPPRATPQNG